MSVELIRRGQSQIYGQVGVSLKGISDGVKYSLPVRVKSVGVNLLNERLINYSNPNFVELLPDGTISFKSSDEPGGLPTQTGIITLKVTGTIRTKAELKKLIKVKEGYRYYFRCLEPSKVDNIFSAVILGEDGKYVERYYGISSGGSVVIPSGIGAKYLELNRQSYAFTCKGIIISEEIDHSYEPYKESIAYIPEVGRSLPNGVHDEVNVVAGKRVQRVSDEGEELATPITTYIDPQPLQIFPNGNRWVEHANKEVAVYNTGIHVANTDLPIREMIKVDKVGLLNGRWYREPIDLADVTVAGDGLSFTIDGATSGAFEQYEFAYYYDSALSTLPELVIPDEPSLVTIKNRNISL